MVGCTSSPPSSRPFISHTQALCKGLLNHASGNGTAVAAYGNGVLPWKSTIKTGGGEETPVYCARVPGSIISKILGYTWLTLMVAVLVWGMPFLGSTFLVTSCCWKAVRPALRKAALYFFYTVCALTNLAFTYCTWRAYNIFALVRVVGWQDVEFCWYMPTASVIMDQDQDEYL
jgi:hypothetical protein